MSKIVKIMIFSSKITTKIVRVSWQNCCLWHNTINHDKWLENIQKGSSARKQHNLQKILSSVQQNIIICKKPRISCCPTPCRLVYWFFLIKEGMNPAGGESLCSEVPTMTNRSVIFLSLEDNCFSGWQVFVNWYINRFVNIRKHIQCAQFFRRAHFCQETGFRRALFGQKYGL